MLSDLTLRGAPECRRRLWRFEKCLNRQNPATLRVPGLLAICDVSSFPRNALVERFFVDLFALDGEAFDHGGAVVRDGEDDPEFALSLHVLQFERAGFGGVEAVEWEGDAQVFAVLPATELCCAF